MVLVVVWPPITHRKEIQPEKKYNQTWKRASRPGANSILEPTEEPAHEEPAHMPISTAPPVLHIDLDNVTAPSLNPRLFGCHHDPGFAQAPHGFLANLIVGAAPTLCAQCDSNPSAVPLWAPLSGSVRMNRGAAFASRSTLWLSATGSGAAAVANRGLGGAGFALEAGKPYEFSAWLSRCDCDVVVELRDRSSGVTLAGATARPGHSSLGMWGRVNLTLTPDRATACEGIRYGSDKEIDCGASPGGGVVCLRCGGELVISVQSKRPGVHDSAQARDISTTSVGIGYVELMPGPWGRLSGPAGPLPVLKSGAGMLRAMGVTMLRSGGTVSQSFRWKDWRGPAWNRPSARHTWAAEVVAGWGPFEVVDMCNALGIEPVITLACESNSASDWADLVEYSWGDATTSWGQQRIADGHPAPYNVTAFELGNEEFNPHFVGQVAAMEKRAKALGGRVPPLRYMFPKRTGIPPKEMSAALKAGLDPSRILTDVHVGAGGGVAAAEALLARVPVAGFDQGVVNLETNAGTHDLQRALDEATDLLAWIHAQANASLARRLYGRAASFCSGGASQFDAWDQGLAFFLPNMTFLQPPGHVHQMLAEVGAPSLQLLDATWLRGVSPIASVALRTADAASLVLALVNPSDKRLAIRVEVSDGEFEEASPVRLRSLSSPNLTAFNSPAKPNAVTAIGSTTRVAAGTLSLTLPAQSFVVGVAKLGLGPVIHSH